MINLCTFSSLDHAVALTDKVLHQVVVVLHLFLVEDDHVAKDGGIEKAVAVLEWRQTSCLAGRLSHSWRRAPLRGSKE